MKWLLRTGCSEDSKGRNEGEDSHTVNYISEDKFWKGAI
jgi:hypothetical protein